MCYQYKNYSQNISYYSFHTESARSGVYFALRAHLNSDWPQVLNSDGSHTAVTVALDWLQGPLAWNPTKQVIRGGGGLRNFRISPEVLK